MASISWQVRVKVLLDINPLDKSILVLSSYRTGSSALCDILSKQLGCKNYDEELFYSQTSCDDIIGILDTKQIVFKFQSDQIKLECLQKLVEKCFIVGLERTNIIDQIASFYICDMTKIWHSTDTTSDSIKQKDIEIDMLKIEYSVRYMIDNFDLFNKYKKYCNICLNYENIITNFSQSKYKPSTKPTNYQQLYKTITRMFLKVKHGELEHNQL